MSTQMAGPPRLPGLPRRHLPEALLDVPCGWLSREGSPQTRSGRLPQLFKVSFQVCFTILLVRSAFDICVPTMIFYHFLHNSDSIIASTLCAPTLFSKVAVQRFVTNLITELALQVCLPGVLPRFVSGSGFQICFLLVLSCYDFQNCFPKFHSKAS